MNFDNPTTNIMWYNASFSSNCFCDVLKNKDHQCDLKPFAQSHLLVRLLICCCLWTNGFLVIRNVYDNYISLMTAHVCIIQFLSVCYVFERQYTKQEINWLTFKMTPWG